MSDVEKGTVHTGHNGHTSNTIHAAPPPITPMGGLSPRRLGNPGPLGLFGFATTTLVLSLYNAGVRGIAVPNVVIGMALFYGGLVQLLAGMWEFALANTFGATAFASYGGFWLSYATIFIPSSGISDAYSKVPDTEFASAVGVYLMSWMVVTFLFFVASLRKNIAFIALFFFLTLTFMMLGAQEFSGNANLGTAGGGLGVITAIIAYYIGVSELLVSSDGIITLPLGNIKRRD